MKLLVQINFFVKFYCLSVAGNFLDWLYFFGNDLIYFCSQMITVNVVYRHLLRKLKLGINKPSLK